MQFEALSNDRIECAWIGIPSGHKHIRVFLKCGERIFVFNEAAFSNLLRGFLTVVTHPSLSAVKLERKEISDGKPGYDRFQLLESPANKQAQTELDAIFEQSVASAKTGKTNT
jgi:hypothetical protein